MDDSRINQPYWALRILYGVVPIVAGLDKFTNLLTDWTQYLNPMIAKLIPAATFMHLVGVIEIIAGLIVLSRFTRLGALVVCAWLVCIALQLFAMGRYFDVGVRDLSMAVGAFALARLAELRQPGTAALPARAQVPSRT